MPARLDLSAITCERCGSAVGAHPVRGKGWSHPTQSPRCTTISPLFGPTRRTRAVTKGGSMPALRPLPSKPSLEFEHKEAKALLRRLRAGDPDALARARARHPAIDVSAPARIKLADAQLVIAREYGFTNWPRLARYVGDLDRQRDASRGLAHERAIYEGSARALLAEHRDRRTWAGRALAAYVPRFYGQRLDDVFASSVTEDDARLAIARGHGYPSWDAVLER